MQHMWAPWRIDYILADKERGCVLCDKLEEGRDRDNLVLFRADRCFVIMNLYPYNNGHLLVSPRRHVARLTALEPEEVMELGLVLGECERILQDVMAPEGFNIGMNIGRIAGAGVEHHLHFHIVPRWGGDTNFMTALGDTRVIPQALTDTYDSLFPHFKALVL
ncbi:HIT domain-containing protein [bacterium]|nr:HIT domain-containing protein [candidate division CSSED10-310 bacterium]